MAALDRRGPSRAGSAVPQGLWGGCQSGAAPTGGPAQRLLGPRGARRDPASAAAQPGPGVSDRCAAFPPRPPRTRHSGEDMSGRYDSLARNHGLPLHQLPDRPSTDQLIRRAVQDEGPRIVDKLLNSSTYLLITLGNEALAVAAQLLTGDLPDRLSPNEDSGRRH